MMHKKSKKDFTGFKKSLPVILVLILLCGCISSREGIKTEEKAQNQEKKNETAETFEFVDVEGREYEAKLIESLPKCSYDMNRIRDVDGCKYYTDKKGEYQSRLGIDVSEFQQSVDWKKVKEAGVDFAMIRVGYRGYGEAGKLVEDKLFRSHMEGASGAGLDIGVYFFSQAVSADEALEEAQFVLDRIGDYTIMLPVAFDTEEIKNDTARTDGLSKEQFTENCVVFCNRIEEAGYDTMIYANMKWMAFTLELEQLKEYDKWYADYEPLPQCPYEFAMWQYTETGTVEGVAGNVDMNVYFDID